MGLRGPLTGSWSVRGQRERDRQRQAGAGSQQQPRATDAIDTDDMPAFLSPECQAIWRELVPKALEDGLPWTRLDVACIAAFVSAVGEHQQAEEHVRNNGLMLRTKPSRRCPEGREYIHPHVAISARARRQILAFAPVLGLTPVSRERLMSSLPIDPGDPDDTLNGNWTPKQTWKGDSNGQPQ
jgi:P27 family predicted phage terminase small subunit